MGHPSDRELFEMLEGIFDGVSLNLPYDCGFDPDSKDPATRAEVNRIRSSVLRNLFLNDHFTRALEAAGDEVMKAELERRWNDGESLSGADAKDVNHFFTHVCKDLAKRIRAQAVDPFVMKLLGEAQYMVNTTHPEAEFPVVKDAPTEP